MYVLFVINLGSRRVRVLGVTRNPDSAWVTKQARNPGGAGSLRGILVVIRDPDSTFFGTFDEVFRSEGVRIIKTPIRAPRANAYAERWVRTVRTESLDWMLVLRAYAAHYNGRSPHRGFGSRRRTRGPVRLGGRPTAHASGCATFWAD